MAAASSSKNSESHRVLRYLAVVQARAGKLRIDLVLDERGLVHSREIGQALILAGNVLVDEQKVEKCSAADLARLLKRRGWRLPLLTSDS